MIKLQKAWNNEDCLTTLEYNPDKFGGSEEDMVTIFHIMSRTLFDNLSNAERCHELAEFLRHEANGEINFKKVVMHD